jgi:hypothetical protein
MILSIGYRVKSVRGIQFRAWSNRVLKDYLLKGYAVMYILSAHRAFLHTALKLRYTKLKFILNTEFYWGSPFAGFLRSAPAVF